MLEYFNLQLSPPKDDVEDIGLLILRPGPKTYFRCRHLRCRKRTLLIYFAVKSSLLRTQDIESDMLMS